MPRRKRGRPSFTRKKTKSVPRPSTRIPPLPADDDVCTPKVRELFRLAVQASRYVCKVSKPARGESPSYSYTDAKAYLAELKAFAEGYEADISAGMLPETKTRRSEIFLDETLYLACQLMGIRFEIGQSWGSINDIRNDIEFFRGRNTRR